MMNARKLLLIEITIREWLVEYWLFIGIILVVAMIVAGGIGGGVWFFIILGFSLLLAVFLSFGEIMSAYFGVKGLLARARGKQQGKFD